MPESAHPTDLPSPEEQAALLQLDVRRAFEAGREAYGELGLDAPVFARAAIRCVRSRLSALEIEPSTENVGDALRRFAGADLYLAQACEADVPDAWARLESDLSGRLRALGRSRGVREAEADELVADVLGQLASPTSKEGARTVIGTYTGAGSLFGWLAVILTRRLASSRRGRQHLSLDEARDGADEGGSGPEPASNDPARLALDTETVETFRTVLRSGWERLTSREQLALVLKFHDEMPQHQMAALLGVGEPRVSRLVNQVLTKLGEGVRSAGLARAEAGDGPPWAELVKTLQESLESWSAGVRPPSDTPTTRKPADGS